MWLEPGRDRHAGAQQPLWPACIGLFFSGCLMTMKMFSHSTSALIHKPSHFEVVLHTKEMLMSFVMDGTLSKSGQLIEILQCLGCCIHHCGLLWAFCLLLVEHAQFRRPELVRELHMVTDWRDPGKPWQGLQLLFFCSSPQRAGVNGEARIIRLNHYCGNDNEENKAVLGCFCCGGQNLSQSASQNNTRRQSVSN